jgi:formylglycine-generating enzyme required for sulfatase activity
MYRALAIFGAILAFVLLAHLRAAPVRVGGVERHASYTETVVQKVDERLARVSFDMVAVPGGQFVMGSSRNEADRKDDEGPQVKVRLKPFWIGKCEVTWDEFDRWYRTGVADNDPPPPEGPRVKEPADAVTRPSKSYVDETYGFEGDHLPAICITHHAAMTYCEWLSKKTGKHYRLPTEAEWEFACRAGTTTPHAIPAGAKLEDYAWFRTNSGDEDRPRGALQAVGKKKPNAWGIHDMHGNVMEWCLDHYVADAYERFAKRPLIDGFVPAPMFRPTDKKWSHVARGGHFKSEAKDLRSAARASCG